MTDRSRHVEPPGGPFDPRVFAPLLLLAAAALAWWTADRGLPNPDEGAGLSAAVKLARGLVFYRHIDAYPFPGASYLLAGAMTLFGEHLSVARALAGLNWCLVVGGLYACALPLLDRQRAAWFALSLLSFKFLAFPNFTAYLYSDLALAAAVGAIALLLRDRPTPGNGRPAGGHARLLGVGLCIGVAALCKQNLGIYLGGAVAAVLLLPQLLGWECHVRAWPARLRALGAVVLGAALAVAPMVLYFAWEGLLGEMLYSGLLRPFRGYLPTSGVPFGVMLEWWDLGSLRESDAQPYLPLHYSEMVRYGQLPGGSEQQPAQWLVGELFSRGLYTSVVVAFVGWGVAWIRALRAAPDDPRAARLPAFGLVVLAVAASAFPRADFPHVVNVYPVVLLLLFALAQREVAARPWLRHLEVAAVCVLLLTTAALATRFHADLTTRLELDRAAVWVNPRDAWIESLLRYIDAEVEPGAPLFVYGHEAHFYFLAGRYFPWPFLQLYPGMAGGDGGRRLGEVLAHVRPRIVVKGVTSWPGTPSLPDYAPALKSAIHTFYALDDRLFDRFPPPGGERPPTWVVSIRRRRDLPPAAP